MTPFDRNRVSFACSIAAAAVALAIGCVPPADEDTDTANDGETGGLTTGTSAVDESESSSGGELPEVSFANDVVPLFQENCVTGVAGQLCHQPGGSWFPTDFTAEVLYTTLLEGDPTQSVLPYITPGEPDDSYVWRKVTNDLAGVGSGLPMPSIDTSVNPPEDPGPLPQAELDIIEGWIVQGALEN